MSPRVLVDGRSMSASEMPDVLVVAPIACVVPTVRAMRVDPVTALRYE